MVIRCLFHFNTLFFLLLPVIDRKARQTTTRTGVLVKHLTLVLRLLLLVRLLYLITYTSRTASS